MREAIIRPGERSLRDAPLPLPGGLSCRLPPLLSVASPGSSGGLRGFFLVAVLTLACRPDRWREARAGRRFRDHGRASSRPCVSPRAKRAIQETGERNPAPRRWSCSPTGSGGGASVAVPLRSAPRPRSMGSLTGSWGSGLLLTDHHTLKCQDTASSKGDRPASAQLPRPCARRRGGCTSGGRPLTRRGGG